MVAHVQERNETLLFYQYRGTCSISVIADWANVIYAGKRRRRSNKVLVDYIAIGFQTIPKAVIRLIGIHNSMVITRIRYEHALV